MKSRWVLSIVCLSGLLLWACATTAATYQITPGDDMVGQAFSVRAHGDDTLGSIGDYYGIGLKEMLEANQALAGNQNQQDRHLNSGVRVVVPAQFILPPYRDGIVINVPELRLYYFTPDGKYVMTYPIALGRTGWETPLGHTYVLKKADNPDWHVPADVRAEVLKQTGKLLPTVVPSSDPENPLGPYAMYLGFKGYLIHGTIQPWSIGRFVSSGCIRMHNKDVTQLFPFIALGTSVHIIDYVAKAGWHNGQLYLEAQEPVNLNASVGKFNPGSAQAVVKLAIQQKQTIIDWQKVEQIAQQADGVPQPIGAAYAALEAPVADTTPVNSPLW